jgi:hypothetical protein
MNPDTGHVVALGREPDRTELLAELARLGYEPVPASLERAAKAVLRGRQSAYVSPTSGGKLSKHMAARRRKERRKRGRRGG